MHISDVTAIEMTRVAIGSAIAQMSTAGSFAGAALSHLFPTNPASQTHSSTTHLPWLPHSPAQFSCFIHFAICSITSASRPRAAADPTD
jgi:hypothetical protein